MINLHGDIHQAYESSRTTLNSLRTNNYKFENIAYELYLAYEARAWYQTVISKNMSQAKNDFYNCSIAAIKETNSGKDVFEYRTLSALNAALSDNHKILKEYEKVEYQLRGGPNKGKTNKDLAGLGKSHVLIDTIIKTMNKDYSGLSKNIIIMESTFMTLKRNSVFENDFKFFKGLLAKDKDLIFESLNTMLTKEHKKRNRHCFYMKDIVSHPVIGYAKISWINDIEIEFDNKLIHNALLPINPNNSYLNEICKFEENGDEKND